MHQTLEIYMARKKRVPGYYNPDSYRVFNENITDESVGDTKLNKDYIYRKKEPPPPHPREPDRRNCPQPYFSKFLTNNARTLNEPICLVQDHNDPELAKHWWPSAPEQKELMKIPTATKDSTQRMDYIDHSPVQRTVQDKRNNLLVTSKGIIPVNPPKREKDPGEVLLEKMSFFHDFNSRRRVAPIKGRLHGCFVWDRVLKDFAGRDVIETAWNRGDLERVRSMSLAKITSATNESNENVDKTVATPSAETIPPIDGVPPP